MLAPLRAVLCAGAILPFALIPPVAGAADRAAPIGVAQWDAFVARTEIGRCVPNFVSSFRTQRAVPDVLVPIDAATAKRLDYGASFEQPLAASVVTHDASWSHSSLTVERDGDVVSFVLQSPGGTERGFFEAHDVPATIPSRSSPFVARLRAHPPAPLLTRTAATRCGLRFLAVHVHGTPMDEDATFVIMRGSTIVGLFEAQEG